MSGFQQFSFGAGDDNIGHKTKRWKGEKDRTYRFSFLWWPGLDKGNPNLDGNPMFTGAQTIYIPNVGYIVANTPEFLKLSSDAPRTRIATVIGVWPTDKSGMIDKNRVSQGEVDVQVWIFSGDKYKSLQQINNEFPFGQHDITVCCTDPQFQKLTFSPCRESLFRTFLNNPKAKTISDRILMEAQAVAQNINNEVGRVMTIQQIRDKLAGSGGDLNALGGGQESVVTGEIDSIVDNILDS